MLARHTAMMLSCELMQTILQMRLTVLTMMGTDYRPRHGLVLGTVCADLGMWSILHGVSCM